MGTMRYLLKRVKTYLGIKDSDNDDILLLMLDDAALAVRSYCHIRKLTPALESLVVQVVMRKFKEDNDGAVASIKMGDVAISYQNAINAGSFSDAERVILNAHRRVIIR